MLASIAPWRAQHSTPAPTLQIALMFLAPILQNRRRIQAFLAITLVTTWHHAQSQTRTPNPPTASRRAGIAKSRSPQIGFLYGILPKQEAATAAPTRHSGGFLVVRLGLQI